MASLQILKLYSYRITNFLSRKNARHHFRHYSSSTKATQIPATQVPLNEPLPGLPTPVYATTKDMEHETLVTTLDNGLRVASQNKFGQFCTVGVVLDSGSRYEVGYPSGISHFLEKLAFNSTLNFSNKDSILKELESYGGICDCQGSRDTLIYAASAYSHSVDPVIRLLSEAVLRPKITDEELEIAKQTIHFELEDIDMKPDQEPILMEMIHAAAYNNNTLGLPKLCPKENIDTITRQDIFTYLKNHFTPERMVIAGVGIDHQALVEAVSKHFVETKPFWDLEPNLVLPPGEGKYDTPQPTQSRYTGGLQRQTKDLSSVSPGPTAAIPELAHLVLGMESSSHHDKDFIAFCTLNMMMGGGGSFSAGGPGKGMYTRLYTNVLNRYHWMYNATAYNHAYNDSGIMCIHASSDPGQLLDLIKVIIKEFINMTGPVGETELRRAKAQLQSMLLMNLEARPIVFEDIGRQVLATGHRKPPSYFIEEINKITAEDIQRVSTRLLRSKPAVAALGRLTQLPPYEDFEAALQSKDGAMPKRFSLFR